jgi:hypothetical protein
MMHDFIGLWWGKIAYRRALERKLMAGRRVPTPVLYNNIFPSSPNNNLKERPLYQPV